MQNLLLALSILFTLNISAQSGKSINDPEAEALLKTVGDSYSGNKNISINYRLLIQKPKVSPGDDERKLTDTLIGSAILEGSKFKIEMNNQQVFCDGKNLWTYMPKEKEAQVNYYSESNDIFSPTKIFTLYKQGFSYQIKEKKVSGGKKLTVIEMVPSGSFSYFKIDVTIDPTNKQILESKIYERNGLRYIYQITKQTSNVPTSVSTFIFDAKKHPDIIFTDLR